MARSCGSYRASESARRINDRRLCHTDRDEATHTGTREREAPGDHARNLTRGTDRVRLAAGSSPIPPGESDRAPRRRLVPIRMIGMSPEASSERRRPDEQINRAEATRCMFETRRPQKSSARPAALGCLRAR